MIKQGCGNGHVWDLRAAARNNGGYTCSVCGEFPNKQALTWLLKHAESGCCDPKRMTLESREADLRNEEIREVVERRNS